MSEQKETVFLDGFIFKRPKEGVPTFVKGHLSIKTSEAIAFLQKNDNNGWVNADLLASKDNSKLYFKLNTWEAPKKTETETNDSALPTYKAPAAEPEVPEISDADIPF